MPTSGNFSSQCSVDRRSCCCTGSDVDAGASSRVVKTPAPEELDEPSPASMTLGFSMVDDMVRD